VLWAADDPDRLSAEGRAAIEDGDNDVFVSAVSAWEIAIKQSLGKLDLVRTAERWLPEVMRRSAFEPLEVGLEAALGVRRLPFHHRDPFDRLLVAHALHEGLTIVTRDDIFSAYGVSTLRA
jgi:PIN domain nuclease of toxin-antitoxin system